MNKLTFTVAAVLGVVLTATLVYAQVENPDEYARKQEAMFGQMAEIMGINVNDLKNAWAEGKPMEQIARENNINMTEVRDRAKEYMTGQAEGETQILADRGVITQEQADRRMETVQEQMQSGKIMGGMMGGWGMMGMPMLCR
ncbi:MAG: hypothetical protein Q8N88_00015 [Nanoarchaeota archaeon]|nr:hypothetical protein [Nanoarchaeota archaeon]